jgi:hypothetical protein
MTSAAPILSAKRRVPWPRRLPQRFLFWLACGSRMCARADCAAVVTTPPITTTVIRRRKSQRPSAGRTRLPSLWRGHECGASPAAWL